MHIFEVTNSCCNDSVANIKYTKIFYREWPIMTTPIEIRCIEVCGTMTLWYQKLTIVHQIMVHKERLGCVILHSNGCFVKWFSLYYSKYIPSCNLIWPHITPLITCKHANSRNFSSKEKLGYILCKCKQHNYWNRWLLIVCEL